MIIYFDSLPYYKTYQLNILNLQLEMNYNLYYYNNTKHIKPKNRMVRFKFIVKYFDMMLKLHFPDFWHFRGWLGLKKS